MLVPVSLRVPSCAFVFIAAGVACSDRGRAATDPQGELASAPISVDSGAAAQLAAAQSGRSWRGFEDDQLRIELALPGFGGMARNEAGRLIVWAPRGASEVSVREMLLREFQRIRTSPELVQDIVASNYTVLPARYSWSRLVEWKDQLAVRLLLRVPHVESVDADELVNRLTVTVSADVARNQVLDLARSIGIDEDAIELRVGGVAIEAGAAFGVAVDALVPRSHSLSHTHRPPVGGVEIENQEALSCSLGLNARWMVFDPGVRVFLTASHCAPGQRGIGVVGTFMRQNTGAGNSVGYIEINPPWNRTDAFFV